MYIYILSSFYSKGMGEVVQCNYTKYSQQKKIKIPQERSADETGGAQ